MPYDPSAAQVELNKLINGINVSLGTQLRFVSVDEVVNAVNDPRAATSSVVSQVNRTPDQQIATIAEAITSDRTKLEATARLVDSDLKASPNLQAAFDDASTRLSSNEFLTLLSPLAPKLSIPTTSGGNIYGLIAENIDILGIHF